MPGDTDKMIGVRYIYNGAPAYGNVAGVKIARVRDQLERQAVFVEVATRVLIHDSRTVSTVGMVSNATVYVEALTCLTHIIKYTKHPTEPEQFLCLKVWATHPGWEIK